MTGTPTITLSTVAASSPAVNTAAMKIEIPDNQHWAKAGQAVTFRATTSAAAAATYTATVTCSTVGGQSLQEYVTIVVATS